MKTTPLTTLLQKGFSPKSKGDKAFVALHKAVVFEPQDEKVEKAIENSATGSGVKPYFRTEKNHGYMPGEDEKVYDVKEDADLDEGMRLVGTHKHGDDSAKVYHDKEWDEYRVKYFKNGKHLSKADSHHPDKEDAHDTAKYQVARLSEMVVPASFAESRSCRPCRGKGCDACCGKGLSEDALMSQNPIILRLMEISKGLSQAYLNEISDRLKKAYADKAETDAWGKEQEGRHLQNARGLAPAYKDKAKGLLDKAGQRSRYVDKARGTKRTPAPSHAEGPKVTKYGSGSKTAEVHTSKHGVEVHQFKDGKLTGRPQKYQKPSHADHAAKFWTKG